MALCGKGLQGAVASCIYLGQEEQVIQVSVVFQRLASKHDHLTANRSQALELA